MNYKYDFHLQFGFVIFWQKNIGAKAARKMLVKFTAVVQQNANGDNAENMRESKKSRNKPCQSVRSQPPFIIHTHAYTYSC